VETTVHTDGAHRRAFFESLGLTPIVSALIGPSSCGRAVPGDGLYGLVRFDQMPSCPCGEPGELLPIGPSMPYVHANAYVACAAHRDWPRTRPSRFDW
jgi:hypothetical protein